MCAGEERYCGWRKESNVKLCQITRTALRYSQCIRKGNRQTSYEIDERASAINVPTTIDQGLISSGDQVVPIISIFPQFAASDEDCHVLAEHSNYGSPFFSSSTAGSDVFVSLIFQYTSRTMFRHTIKVYHWCRNRHISFFKH